MGDLLVETTVAPTSGVANTLAMAFCELPRRIRIFRKPPEEGISPVDELEEGNPLRLTYNNVKDGE
jgi:hypothetical protein